VVTRTVLLGLVAAAIVTVSSAAWFATRPNPDREAAKFAAALERKRWDAIYDMALDLEKSRQGWERHQFITLMRDIEARKIDRFEIIETIGDWAGQSTSKHFVYHCEVRQPNGEVTPVSLVVKFYLDHGEWRPAIGQLPLALYNLREKSSHDDLMFLVEASERAGVKRFLEFRRDQEYSISQARLWLEGKASRQSIQRPRRDP
jgi:hypothetical protein